MSKTLTKMKILITGAHFTPALAVIVELKKHRDVQIVYVGRKTTLEGHDTKSIESQELPKLGVKFIPIIAGRIQRHLSIYTILSLLKIPIGFIQAFYIILKEQPAVILSFGGYVSVPLVVMGWLWSIPIILHEQTLVSGLANKFSTRFANKICISFPNHELSASQALLTGNPLRPEILNPIEKLPESIQKIVSSAKKDNLPIIYITGGSQGSHIINITVEAILDKLLRKAYVVHQTGDSKYQDFERLSLIQNDRYLVTKWVGSEIGKLLQKVDLVVGRAGANTLTELAYFCKPALVIPIPYLYQNEQMKNAHFFEKLGLVKILPQSKLNGENLLDSLTEMLGNLEKLHDQAKVAQDLVIPDAAKRLALETMLLANKG